MNQNSENLVKCRLKLARISKIKSVDFSSPSSLTIIPLSFCPFIPFDKWRKTLKNQFLKRMLGKMKKLNNQFRIKRIEMSALPFFHSTNFPLQIKLNVKVVFIIFIFSIFGINFSHSQVKEHTVIPQISVAEVDDALATTINPAGLGIGRNFNGYYFRTYYGDSSKDDAVFLQAGKTGFSAEFAKSRDDIDFRSYTLSSGSRLFSNLYFGVGYSWYTSEDKDYDELSSWDIGLLYRRRFISLGIMGYSLNHPQFREKNLPRKYDFSLALRPLNPRITMAVDVLKVEEVEGVDFSFSLRLEPIDGLTLRGRIDEDKNFDVMLGFVLSRFGLGSYNRFNSDTEHLDGVGYLYLSQAHHNRYQIRKPRYLKVNLSSIDMLERAKDDDKIAGVVLRVNKQDYGFGEIQEFRDKILDFKSSGKKVIFYRRSCKTGMYSLASACDKVILHPSGDLNLIGIRSESIFIEDTLEKIGVEGHFERIGKYKSATEMFTRNNMSEPSKEQENAILDSLYDQLTKSIAEGRKVKVDEVKKSIDSGPYTAKQAKSQGVIDEVLYEDELDEFIQKTYKEKLSLLEAKEYSNEILYKREWKYEYPKIACINAKGLMTTGESFSNPFTGTQVMGSDTISKAIKDAREDESVKAIVLRIDSGGGLVMASDIIWRQIMLTKDKKPIVVSMGNMAASGGYYIAAPADVIVAEPGTITGSIGVFSGRYNLRGLYDKMDANKVILKRGEHADFYSDYSKYTPYHQKVIEKEVKELYDTFIEKVAEARKMDKSKVHQIGQGRVWTGLQALEIGLVDELGGLDLAIEIAKEKANIPKEKKVELVSMPEIDWMSRFFESELLIPVSKRFLNQNLLSTLSKQRVWLLMPYNFKM